MENKTQPQYSDLHVRMDTNIKNKAEAILDDLGIAPSSAINMFYRQVIAHDGMPFKIVRFAGPIPNEDNLSHDEIMARLKEAERGIAEGRYRPAEDVFRDILGDKYEEI